MSRAKDGSLTAKETAAVDFYLDPGSESYNNWEQSYLAAGYKKHVNWTTEAKRVRDRPVVNGEIERRRLEGRRAAGINKALITDMFIAGYDVAKQQSNPTGMATNTNGVAKVHGLLQEDAQNDALPDQLTEAEYDQLKDMARSATALRLSSQATGAAPDHGQGQGVGKVGSEAKTA